MNRQPLPKQFGKFWQPFTRPICYQATTYQ